MEYQGVSIFPNIFFVASLCSFICLQAVYQLSGPVCKGTWNGCPSYSLLTFISHFVIDFLSIRKVIIFSAIATDGRHPLRSRSIHQNAANWHDDSFPLFCAGKPTPHAHVMIKSLRKFVAVETVLRRGRMFQGSDFRILYFIMLNKKNSERLTCLYSAVDLERFLQLLLLQWSRYR